MCRAPIRARRLRIIVAVGGRSPLALGGVCAYAREARNSYRSSRLGCGSFRDHSRSAVAVVGYPAVQRRSSRLVRFEYRCPGVPGRGRWTDSRRSCRSFMNKFLVVAALAVPFGGKAADSRPSIVSTNLRSSLVLNVVSTELAVPGKGYRHEIFLGKSASSRWRA
jgi:hypothetical protein